MMQRTCNLCATPYFQKRRDQLFCGPRCRDKVRNAKARAAPGYSERRRAHYQQNAEHIKARAYAWARANPEKVKAAASKWRSANADKVRAARVAYRAENIDRIRALMAAWNRQNRDRKAANESRRRAALAAACGAATAEQIAARWDYYGGKCWICGASATTTDHVKPLSRGGSHWPANLRPACGPCNFGKQDTWPFVPPPR